MQRRPNTSRFSMGERGRRIAHTGSWSLVAKASAAAHLFLSVPFVLATLGPTRFGAWATLVALVTFAGFLDFGVGNGAMNLVAAAHGRGAKEEVTTILIEARRTLLRVASSFLAAIAIAGCLVPWHRVLGMPQEMASECRASALVVLISIVASVPLNLANRVQLGLGRGDRAFLWQAIGQWLALAAVVLLARAHASLVVLTAAAVSTPLIASLINSLQLWRKFNVRNAPTTRDIDLKAIRRAIRLDGMAFFGLQLSAALAFSADLPLISSLAGADEAGKYAIAQRLFSVIPLVLSLVWAPLWPIYRHALAGGNIEWVVQTLKRSLISAVAFALFAGAAIAIGFEPIVTLWTRKPIEVSAYLITGMAIWCVIEAAGTAIATFLNAANVLRYQLFTAIAFAATCFPIKAWVLINYGVSGIPWVTITTYVLASGLPFALFGRRILADALSRDH